MSKSHASSPYTTVACLKAGDQILGLDRIWNGVSPEQRAWLDSYARLVPEIGRIPEIASNATYDLQNHADFLKKHGWEPQITECGPDEFLLAGVMSVIGHWLKEGDRGWIEKHGGINASVVTRGVDICTRRGTNERCVRMRTKTGDFVWIEMVPKAPEGMALAVEAESRFSDGFDLDPDFESVTFPMIDFADKLDFAWLKELWTTTVRGTKAKIIEAKQQVELKANHVGFRARSADEMRGVEECCFEPPPTFTIDEPFIMAVTRPGLSLPIFTAHLTPDAWKDPGNDFLK